MPAYSKNSNLNKMDSQKYLIDQILELVSKVPDIMVRYENHKPSATHFIEVRPADIQLSNSHYIELESDLMMKFMEAFPAENICFINNEDKIGIVNVDYEIIGKAFADQEHKVKSIWSSHTVKSFEIHTQMLKNLKIAPIYASNDLWRIEIDHIRPVFEFPLVTFGLSKIRFTSVDYCTNPAIFKLEESDIPSDSNEQLLNVA